MGIVVDDGVIRIERLELGPWPTNAYVITCLETKDSALVDAPADANEIMRALRGTNPKYILITHGHGDHIGALPDLKSLGAPIAVHTADADRLPVAPQVLLKDEDMISIGKIVVEVRHTPGHSPGSLCFRMGRYLVCGDIIFPGGPGKSKSPADLRQILKSITEKILILPDDTELYPGHGPPTTCRQARQEFAVFSSRTHDQDLCGDVLWLSS